MGLIVAVLILIVVLVVAGAAIGFVAKILLMLLIGLIIGALARLVIPGRQSIGVLMTAILGAIGALLGGIAANAIGVGNVIEFIISILVAAALVGVFSGKDRSLTSDSEI